MYNNIDSELSSVISLINQFWKLNVSNIQLVNKSEEPVSMFTLHFTLYGDKHVSAEYERSTLGFYVLIGGEHIGLSKLTNETVFKGFTSYKRENILHNFTVLDKLITSM